jgi:DNA-binding CsgD family transcriptional regulator
VLLGRDTECARLDLLIDNARTSQGGTLLVRGEAGVGKTELLEYAGARPDLRVLRGTGVQSETDLAYGSAHQLLRPLLPLLPRLPGPQARAVEVAFGMADGEAPDRFLVALGFLTLLSEAGQDQTVLCVIDDAQWGDSPSTDAMFFVARRVSTDPVAILLAVRDEPGVDRFEVAGVEELVLAGLPDDAAGELLDGSAQLAVPESVRAALVARTRGNPLALLEVARALTRGQLAGQEPLPDPLPVGDRLERAFLTRTQQLSAEAQKLVLVAAADESGEPDVVLAAAVELGASDRAREEAEEAGLLVLRRGRFELGHPLVRSAVYREAMPADRRRAHLALANAQGVRGDADRRTWHLAGAATGPDESIAAALDAVADQARRRSGHGAASAGYERAAELSPSSRDRTRRLVAAAESAWLAGQPTRALALVDRAEALATDPESRSALLHLRGRIALRAGEVGNAYGILLDGALIAIDVAPMRALEMLADAAEAAEYAGDSARGRESAKLVADIEPGTAAGERFLSYWLSGGAALASGDTVAGTTALRRAIAMADELHDPRLLVWAGVAAVHLGDMEQMLTLFRRAVDRARRTGAAADLPYPLEYLSMTEAVRGGYPSARSMAEEGLRLARETGQVGSVTRHLSALAFIAATRGEAEDCRLAAHEALELAAPHGLSLSHATAVWALARLDLGAGRVDDAVDPLLSMQRPAAGTYHPAVSMWSIPDLVEASARAGRGGEVTGLVDRLASWAAEGGAPGVHAMVRRCRGTLGGVRAGDDLAAAASAYAELDFPYDEARCRLLLGEHLRRDRQRSVAREHLRAAFVTFDRLGARPWADRAAAELRATGESVQRDAAEGLGQLTPQELQIVRQVSQGASNRDVAAQLFLSPRTVEYHLYKAYPKLGISSRTQLIRRYGGDPALVDAG